MTRLDPYDPQVFRDLGHALVDRVADYLTQVGARGLPVLEPQDPRALLDAWSDLFPEAPGADEGRAGWDRLLEGVLAHSNHLHHPAYVGHQVAVTVPPATLVELVVGLLSNGMAIFEMGQLHTILERRVIEFLTSTVGFEAGGGVLTHGGSVGNLTALLAARQATAGHDVWTEGSREPLAVLVSEQAHYCIARAVQVMGWGAGGAWPVATDARFRMDLEDLPRAHAAAEAAGRRVVAVVGSACSTATGSFDPLTGIADYCAQHGLWMHVDGAHGASLALSPKTRDRLTGIERADSVVWDLHKMMGLPALSTAVLFREERRAYEAFAQEAGYLFDATPPQEQWFNLGHRTLECTKRGMGVTAAFLFHLCGTAWFGEQVEAMVERAGWLRDLVEASEDFELACDPEANIVCFRHRGTDDQARLRDAVVNSGSHYLVQTLLRGELWLRCTLMNPRTTRADLESLLEALRAAATPEPTS